MHLPTTARAITLAGLAFFVFACSSGFDTRPRDLDSLPSDYGVVVLQVTNNADELGHRLDTWTGAHVTRVGEPGSHFLLKPAGSGLISSRIFIGALPPGRYRIQNLISEWPQHSKPQVWMEAPAQNHLGTFRLEPGQLTSLGTVLFQPLGAVEEDGRWKRVHMFLRYDSEERFDQFMDHATPDLAERLGERVHGWDIGRNDQAHHELADRVSEFAIGTEYHWLGDGEIAMTGPIGAVFISEAAGQWRQIETGVNHQLAAMAKTSEGYVVAGERGLVLRTDETGGNWEELPGPGLMTAVEWLQQMNNGSFYAIGRGDERCVLFHVTEDFSRWKPVLEVEDWFDWRVPTDRPCQIHTASMAGDRIVAFDGQRRIEFDNQGNMQLEEQSKRWTLFTEQPNGVSIAVPDTLGSEYKSQVYTLDGGASWSDTARDWPAESDRLGEVSIMYLLPDGRAMAFSYKGYVDDFSKRVLYEKQPRFRLSNVDGDIVRWGEQIESYCRNLLPEISTEERMFARCSDGSLIVSEDGGESWNEDFEPGEGNEELSSEAFENTI